MMQWTSRINEEECLLRGINSFRKTLKLQTLTDNDKAECLAEEIAEQFKNQPCTNTTGANTVPGTEASISRLRIPPEQMQIECHYFKRCCNTTCLCPPNLDQDMVLSNYTNSKYSGSLNDTRYAGIGIGSDDNWIVVILTTNTPTGNFAR